MAFADTTGRRILFFPLGNNVEHTSFYLEHGFQDQKMPKDWYACVQFGLVLWNPNDPEIFVHHSTSRMLEYYWVVLIANEQLLNTDLLLRKVIGALQDLQTCGNCFHLLGMNEEGHW